MAFDASSVKASIATRAAALASTGRPSAGGAGPTGGPQGVFDVSNDGTNWVPAVRLRSGTGTSFTVVNGEVTLTGQSAGMIEYATHADFRASTAPADGTQFRIVSPPGEYRYSTSSGAGWADDDDTILKPTAVDVSANGRAFSTRASEHAATFAAARAMVGLLGRAKHVHIACHTSLAGGGGGVFDVYPVGAYVDDNGWTIVAGTAALVRRGASTREVNPRDFGALGDDAAVDNVAINAAKAKIANGGTLLFPNGVYRLTAPINLLSGQSIVGMSGQYHGACRLHIVTNGESCVTIGERVTRACVRNIALEGTGTLTVNVDPDLSIEYDDSYGIKMEGDYPNSSYQHEFVGCTFYQLGTGIYAGSTSVSQWQCDNVEVGHCTFAEVGHSIHLNSQNCTYWKIRNCGLSTAKHDGIAVRLERCGGLLSIDTCAGGGSTGTGTLVKFEMHSISNINSCQAENIAYTFDFAGPSSETVTLTDCVCDGDVRVSVPMNLNLIGGRVPYHLYATNAAKIHNIGCLVGEYVLSGSSLVVSEEIDGHSKRYISELNPVGFPVESVTSGLLLTTTGETGVVSAYALPSGNFRVDSYFTVAGAATVVTLSLYNDSVDGGTQTTILTGTYDVGRHLVPSYMVPAQHGSGSGGYIVLYATAGTANNVRVFASIDNVSGAYR
jgi:hypothetical protein